MYMYIYGYIECGVYWGVHVLEVSVVHETNLSLCFHAGEPHGLGEIKIEMSSSDYLQPPLEVCTVHECQ